MMCRMPIVSLPGDLMEDMKESPSGKIDGTQGPGVASYLASGGNVRVDIYVGFNTNGFSLYRNISAVHPNIKMQFALKPLISCQPDVLTFQSGNDDTITIQVL